MNQRRAEQQQIDRQTPNIEPQVHESVESVIARPSQIPQQPSRGSSKRSIVPPKQIAQRQTQTPINEALVDDPLMEPLRLTSFLNRHSSEPGPSNQMQGQLERIPHRQPYEVDENTGIIRFKFNGKNIETTVASFQVMKFFI